MMDSMAMCWREWILLLLSGALLFRSAIYMIEVAARSARGDWRGLTVMMQRQSRMREWESRAMTATVAMACLLISFKLVNAAAAVLAGWMIWRLLSFAGNRRLASYAICAMCAVGWLAAVGERI